MYQREDTSHMAIDGKETVFLDVTGAIEKIVIDIKKLSDIANIEIYTADGERIVRFEGKESCILYPRNKNISTEIYEEVENLNEISKLTIERWVNVGNLKIVIDNDGEEGLIDNISIVFNDTKDVIE